MSSNERKITIKCPHCRKKYSLSQFSVRTEVAAIPKECVFSDSGYGDNDRYADILYLNFYVGCPFCGYTTRSIRGVRIGEVGWNWDYDTDD